MFAPTPTIAARHSRFVNAALALLAAIAGLVVPAVTATTASAAVLPNGFKSVGYMPSWAGNVNSVQYGKLTHINYAFLVPRSDGTLPAVDNASKLRSLVSLAHANNVKVLISMGGWNNGNDSAFESLAGSSTTRDRFVAATVSLIDSYSLDGVDIDWEYPNPGASGDHFRLLMQQLSSAMHGRGKLLTAAVVSGGYTAQGVQPAVFGYVDFLNIMLYDGGSPHANYDWTISNVNEWKSRGLPAEKAILGVPFYSRPGYYSYAQLVAMDPANADRDCTMVNGAQQCYNGRPTIRRKTQWAMANAGGMMNWELSQDTGTATSLVSTIFDTASVAQRTGQITGVGGKCVDVAGAQSTNGTAVQLYGCNGSGAQSWSVNGDGTLRALGKCLDVQAGQTVNGAVTQLWDCNGTGAQVWQQQSDGTLRNPQSGRCLDATGYSSADGTRLQIWDCFGAVNQRWQLP